MAPFSGAQVYPFKNMLKLTGVIRDLAVKLMNRAIFGTENGCYSLTQYSIMFSLPADGQSRSNRYLRT